MHPSNLSREITWSSCEIWQKHFTDTSGFNASLLDAVALGQAVSTGLEQQAFKALAQYETMRLEKVQQMVRSGMWFSQSFGNP